jgi:hypothetical protein
MQSTLMVHEPKMDAKFFFVAASILSKGNGIRIPVRPENGSLITESFSMNGVGLKLVIDLNSADLIVPVCKESNSECIDPYSSGSFRYCSGSSYCYDRQIPPLQCRDTVPSTEWSLDTSTWTRHGLTIDGAQISIKSFEFTDSLTVNDKTYAMIPAKGAPDIGRGVAGFAPSRRSCRNETWLSALGFEYVDIGPNELKLNSDRPEFEWTPTYQTIPTNSSTMLGKYAFNLFRPTICGIDLLDEVSSQWTAMIDTTIECLILPSFLHDNLKVWKSGSNNVLYFEVSREGGHGFVSLNLNDVCIQSISYSERPNAITGLNPIVIGYRALQALGAVKLEAQEPFRLSFRTEESRIDECTITPVGCTGQQTYHKASNSCIDPRCEEYLFGRIDYTSKLCEVKAFVPLMVYSIIAAVFIGELVVYQIRRKAVAIAQEACERS